MRILFYLLSTMAVLHSCRVQAESDSTNVLLSVYIVSEAKMDGTQLIDTLDFPKLGYIAAKPNLVISRLEAVNTGVVRSQDTLIDKDGKRTVFPESENPTVVIRMRSEDAKKFSSLTENAIGKRVLLMLGNTPLSAPIINAPISTQSMQLTCGNHSDQKVILDELKKLVR